MRNDDARDSRRDDTQDATALLEHKEYSLKWIASKLISKAEQGVESVPRMRRKDQVRLCVVCMLSALR